MASVASRPFVSGLARELAEPTDGQSVRLYWLGQAGFAVRCFGRLLLIDPYLSDYLAAKYRDHEFSHERMMPAPIKPEALPRVDIVLCTHRHSDHMDPEALPTIARGNPECAVVIPRVELDHAASLGIEERQLRGLAVGQRALFGHGAEKASPIVIEAIASAHEELSVDERGASPYLGYVVGCCGVTLYHSGDCVPYPGLAERLKALRIDAALLPINGRSAQLRERGIPGNFTLEEAIDLCGRAQIPFMMGHHFGMFAFNTVDRSQALRGIAEYGSGVRCELADVDTCWELRR